MSCSARAQGHHCHFRTTEVDTGLQLQSHSENTKPLSQFDSIVSKAGIVSQDPVILPPIPAPAHNPPACSPSHRPSVGAASLCSVAPALAKAAAGARDSPPRLRGQYVELAEASAALLVGSP